MRSAAHGAYGPAPEVEKEVTIYIGGVHAAGEPTVVKTLLGSCISVCLWDPATSIGGMNHFMLPNGSDGRRDADATRFGVHAMDVLIGTIMKIGGDRRRLQAKVFGGAHVLNIQETADGVPQRNIQFIRRFLDAEGFRVLAEDVGGYLPRHVRFSTHNGRAGVKRVSKSDTRAHLIAQERQREPRAPRYGDVTLFE